MRQGEEAISASQGETYLSWIRGEIQVGTVQTGQSYQA